MTKRFPLLIGLEQLTFNLINNIFSKLREIDSSTPSLRSFGFLITIFLFIVASYLYFNAIEAYRIVSLVGLFVLVFTLFFPFVIMPFQKLWMGIALVLGWIMTRVILLAAFYLIVAPISLFLRLFGHRFLDLSFTRARVSYWELRRTPSREKSSYMNQY